MSEEKKSGVRASDKRVVNGKGNINQLAPFKYPWAFTYFTNANKNHWVPLDVNMTQDVHDFRHKLSDNERHVYENVLAYLTTSDIMAMRNIGLAVMERMTAPELQLYQARQVFEEALHCYVEGTEVLTGRGWVDFRDLADTDTVADFNANGKVTFVNHLGVTKDHYEGNLVVITGDNYLTKVTPNHNCAYFDFDDTELTLAKAGELELGKHGFPVSARTFNNNRRVSLDNETRLTVATLAHVTSIEGHDVILHEPRSISRLVWLCKTSDIEYEMGCDDANSAWFKIVNFATILQCVLESLERAYLPALNYSQCTELLSELTTWGRVLYGDFKRVQETFSALAPLCGTVMHVDDRPNGTSVHFEHRTCVNGLRLQKSLEAYNGNVYSVGVPSRVIITRLDGKVVVSGNTWTYQHCIETIGLDQDEIYNRYLVVPEINAKIRMAEKRLAASMSKTLDLTNPDHLREFVMSYIFFAAIFEGCWFYNGFTPIFALQRRGLMKGTGEQLQYIMRDEVMHASFGIRVANQIIKEEGVVLDPQEVRDMWDEAEQVERDYAGYILKKPMLGYTKDQHIAQFHYMANRRARALHLEEPFPGATNACEWLDEQALLKKEKNFFETRVTEYQSNAGLEWDDDDD